MENRKVKTINRIEKVLSDSEMLEVQRKTLVMFDSFNEVESTRQPSFSFLPLPILTLVTI